MTSNVVDFKIGRLKMMSVPESRTAVERPDGINGRDRVWLIDSRCQTYRYILIR